MIKTLQASLHLLFTSVPLLAGQSMVSGTVVDDAGAPLQNISVNIRRVASLPPRPTVPGPQLQIVENKSSSVATSDSKGTFSFHSVPTGKYYVCAYSAITSGLVSNCEWMTTLSPVIIDSKDPAFQLAPVVLRHGSTIGISVQDVNGLLANPKHTFRVGVISGSGYYA